MTSSAIFFTIAAQFRKLAAAVANHRRSEIEKVRRRKLLSLTITPRLTDEGRSLVWEKARRFANELLVTHQDVLQRHLDQCPPTDVSRRYWSDETARDCIQQIAKAEGKILNGPVRPYDFHKWSYEAAPVFWFMYTSLRLMIDRCKYGSWRSTIRNSNSTERLRLWRVGTLP